MLQDGFRVDVGTDGNPVEVPRGSCRRTAAARLHPRGVAVASDGWHRVLQAARVAWDCDSEDERAWERAVRDLEREVKAWARSNGWMPATPPDAKPVPQRC